MKKRKRGTAPEVRRHGAPEGRGLIWLLHLQALAEQNGVAFTPWVALPRVNTPDVHRPLRPALNSRPQEKPVTLIVRYAHTFRILCAALSARGSDIHKIHAVAKLTCSRCATVGHSSTDCTLEPKCINCSPSHSADSKLCPRWKTEKLIQEIKTNRNVSYLEARKLIAPPISQSYAQATKSLKVSATTQTDENITKIKCPPLKLLQQPSSLPQNQIYLHLFLQLPHLHPNPNLLQKRQKVSERGLPGYEFEPSTTKDPSCRAAMHVKSVES
ncbi:uncharacterized protein TNCV_2061101 [Trichonephila clavipes]|nr:uncharacterized protein TNCV_2061101 [Trichonephila clavipes]